MAKHWAGSIIIIRVWQVVDNLKNKIIVKFNEQPKAIKFATISVVGLFFIGFANLISSIAGANGDSNKLHILPVSVATVNYQNNHAVSHEFTGHIVAGRRSTLSFEVGGKILEIYKDNGDEVEKGEPLAKLILNRFNARLKSLEAQKLEVSARLELSQRSLARREETYQDSHTSAQVLDEAKANEAVALAQLERISAEVELAKIDLASATLKAPFDGYVDRRILDEGEIVGPGTPVFTFLEKANYEAQVGVPNEYVSLLEIGSTVELLNQQGEIINSQVVRISPAIRGDTRTQLVSLKLLDIDLADFGSLVTMQLNSQRQVRGFWVPITALTADVRGLWRLYKLMDDEQGRAKIAIENVQVLHVDNERAFVTGSLDSGAIFVSEGVERITPNQVVKPINSQLSAGE